MVKPALPNTTIEEDAPVIDTDGGPQFVIDQMCDTLERAVIDARARLDDPSVRWCHGVDSEEGPRVFSVSRDDFEPVHGLSVDEAKALIDGMGL